MMSPGFPRRRPTLVAVAAAAVAVGLLPLPGEYYALVRIVLAGLALYYVAHPGVHDAARWVLVGLVVLHNPIVPIDVGRGVVWAVIHLATVAIFWWVQRRLS